MTVKYMQGLCASCGLVYSPTAAPSVPAYRFGEGKSSNEIAHETKMSRFTN